MRISDWSSDVCSSDLHRAAFGTEILHAPVETWPANYPNVEQARFLLRNGAPEPVIATLTRIGTVEGFGSLIRFLAPTDMQRHFDDGRVHLVRGRRAGRADRDPVAAVVLEQGGGHLGAPGVVHADEQDLGTVTGHGGTLGPEPRRPVMTLVTKERTSREPVVASAARDVPEPIGRAHV